MCKCESGFFLEFYYKNLQLFTQLSKKITRTFAYVYLDKDLAEHMFHEYFNCTCTCIEIIMFKFSFKQKKKKIFLN